MAAAGTVYIRTGARFPPAAHGFPPFTFVPRIMPDA